MGGDKTIDLEEIKNETVDLVRTSSYSHGFCVRSKETGFNGKKKKKELI